MSASSVRPAVGRSQQGWQAASTWASLLLPVGYALYSVLALAFHNRGQLGHGQINRSLALAVVVPLVLGLFLTAAGAGSIRAGIVVGLGVIAFFSYGHIYNLARQGPEWLLPVARHRYLAPGIAGLVAGVSIWVLRRKDPPIRLWQFFSVGAVVLPAIVVVPWLAATASAWVRAGASAGPAEVTSTGGAPSGGPDIYYILLDGFGRLDILRELYGFDSTFLDESLARLGFYRAACSHSNYSQTSLSLASSLNMEYLDGVASAMGSNSRDLAPLHTLIMGSEVRRQFEARGYHVAAFESGYPMTEMTGADAYLAPQYSEGREENAWLTAASLNEFEGFLLTTTAARVILDLYLQRQESSIAVLEYPYLRHRQRVEFTLGSLAEVAEWEGSYWVFAHVLSPHPPFVFGPNGEAVPNPGPYTLQDFGSWDRDEYIERYRGQVQFLSRMLVAAVEGILQRAPRDSIIILQGDHGPAAHQQIEDPFAGNLTERMSILNAVYFPDRDYSRMDPGLTPVNTFRAVLSHFFGAGLEPLPDRSFFSPGNMPYAWRDVTGQLRDETCTESAASAESP